MPYIKNFQILICPSDSRARPIYTNSATNMEKWSYGRNYGYFNGVGGKTTVMFEHPLGNFPKPAETVLLSEPRDCNRCGPRTADWPGNGDASVDARMVADGYLDPRHNDGYNCNFHDGHAKWYRSGGSQARMWSLEDD